MRFPSDVQSVFLFGTGKRINRAPALKRLKESQQDYLLKYLMLKLAPVLLKLKPAYLFALSDCARSNGKNHYCLWEEQKKDIARTLNISFKELKNSPCAKQVLFYDQERLFSALTQPESLAFLRRFGYSSCQRVEDYLKMLKRRFCSVGIYDTGGNACFFPHEIGLFLGYPLKDVQGFIKKKDLPSTYMGRWQVFGETEESMRLMRLYEKAEMVFSNFIKNGRDPILWTERITAHFRKIGEGVIYGV